MVCTLARHQCNGLKDLNNGTLSGKQPLDDLLVTSQLAICFATNIDFISLVTLECAFSYVGKLLSGQEAILSTAVFVLVILVWAFATVGSTTVLVLVTLVWALATVGRSQFESFTFENQAKVTKHNFLTDAIPSQMSKSTNVFFTFSIFTKV